MTYIAFTAECIWGIGETADAAIADAYQGAGMARDEEWNDLDTAECTDALFATVKRQGGNISWGKLSDGTHCTTGEEEAEDDARADLAATFAERIEDLVNIQVVPDAAVDWAPARLAMLRRMAEALLLGNERVTVSKWGQLQWTAAASVRHETRVGDKRPVPLSIRGERVAAEEMSENLGDPRFLADIGRRDAERRLGKRERLAAIGTALYGPEWVSPMAAALDVALRTAQRWASGETEIPERVLIEELPTMAKRAVDAGVTRKIRARAEAIERLAALA